jgi:hypothetical protein
MEATSFCGGVHHKRYSGQQETAPKKYTPGILHDTIKKTIPFAI